MYQIAVCEDEASVREALCQMCGELLSERNISHEITAFSGVIFYVLLVIIIPQENNRYFK